MKNVRNTRYLYSVLIVALILIVLSCNREASMAPGQVYNFIGTMENGDKVKTMLTDNGSHIMWEPGDAIRIFHSGQEGRYTSSLTSLGPTSSFVSDSHFSSDDSNGFFAIYPYSDKDSFDGTSATITIPYWQVANQESFDKNAFVMLAQSNDNTLRFKNLCGGVKLSIAQDGVYSIAFMGNNNETIAGRVKASFLDGVPVVEEVHESQKKIVISSPDGKCFEKDTWYYISCLPTSLSKGFTIELYKNKGDYPLKSVYTYDKATSIQRSVWGRISDVDDSLDYSISPKDNVVFYKTISGNLADINYNYSKHYKDESLGYNVLVFKSAVTAFPTIFRENSDISMIVLPSNTTSINDYAFYKCTGLTDVILPESLRSTGTMSFRECTGLTNVRIPQGVTTINHYSFYNCTGLKSFLIPNSVMTIENNAFSGCTSLEEVVLPERIKEISEGLFFGCSNLHNVIIPESVTTIAPSAFNGCSCLKNVVIPESVSSIGKYAFNGCAGLVEISIPNKIKCIEDYLFSDCSSLQNVEIPEGVTSIGNKAFNGCTSLLKLSIPSAVTTIGESAFLNCKSLTTMVIPEGVTRIEKASFEFCTSLTSITIPNSITSIGGVAFYGCSSLSSIFIPENVTVIDSGAFYNCTGLESVHISNLSAWCSITFIGDNPLANEKVTNLYLNGHSIHELSIPSDVTAIGSNAFKGYRGLTSVYMPDSVISIGGGAFADCTGLSSVSFSNNAKTIGDRAFYRCQNLKSVIIPDSVETIGVETFLECYGLTSIMLPNALTKIESKTFLGCKKLKSILIPDNVISIGERAFYACEGLTNILVSKSLRSIGNNAFGNCRALKDVFITDLSAWCGISFVSVFPGAKNLYLNEVLIQDLVIPSDVVAISERSFAGYSCIKSVVIPTSVTSIGSSAFSSCNNMTSVTVESLSPPSAGKSVFSGNASSRKIYVPASSLEDYKVAAGWNEYAESIYCIQ